MSITSKVPKLRCIRYFPYVIVICFFYNFDGRSHVLHLQHEVYSVLSGTDWINYTCGRSNVAHWLFWETSIWIGWYSGWPTNMSIEKILAWTGTIMRKADGILCNSLTGARFTHKKKYWKAFTMCIAAIWKFTKTSGMCIWLRQELGP